MLDTFRPLLDAARGVDLTNAAEAEAELGRRLDPSGPVAAQLAADLRVLLDRGEIADRGELQVRYGRVAKAGPDTDGFSIDVVLMTGAGPRHTHPNGEVDYCIALDGDPTFDERPAGWVVCEAGSTHVPTVAGGTMLIVYLLPDGAIEFHA